MESIVAAEAAYGAPSAPSPLTAPQAAAGDAAAPLREASISGESFVQDHAAQRDLADLIDGDLQNGSVQELMGLLGGTGGGQQGEQQQPQPAPEAGEPVAAVEEMGSLGDGGGDQESRDEAQPGVRELVLGSAAAPAQLTLEELRLRLSMPAERQRRLSPSEMQTALDSASVKRPYHGSAEGLAMDIFCECIAASTMQLAGQGGR